MCPYCHGERVLRSRGDVGAILGPCRCVLERILIDGLMQDSPPGRSVTSDSYAGVLPPVLPPKDTTR